MDFKCFDATSEIIEEATKKFAPKWKLDKGKFDILEDYCSAFDSLIEEFDGESFEVSVDENTMTIAISIECTVIDIPYAEHKFCQLVDRSVEISFKTTEGGNVNVTFVFPSVWTKC